MGRNVVFAGFSINVLLINVINTAKRFNLYKSLINNILHTI